MKYQLLLKDIHKYTERIGNQAEIENLKQACNVMHVVPKEANDMMNVGRLQGFDVSFQSILIILFTLSPIHIYLLFLFSFVYFPIKLFIFSVKPCNVFTIFNHFYIKVYIDNYN